MLVAGMSVALLVAIAEFIWKSRKQAIEKHVSTHFSVTITIEIFSRSLLLVIRIFSWSAFIN